MKYDFWQHLLRPMDKECKILGHLPRFNRSNTSCFKFLRKIQESGIAIQLCPDNTSDNMKLIYDVSKNLRINIKFQKLDYLNIRGMSTNVPRQSSTDWLPVCKTSWPSKDRSYAVCAGLTSFLVNPVMAGNCTMGCFSFNGLSIWAHLEPNQSFHTSKVIYVSTSKVYR